MTKTFLRTILSLAGLAAIGAYGAGSARAAEEQPLARVAMSGEAGNREFALFGELDGQGNLVAVVLRDGGGSRRWTIDSMRGRPQTLAKAPLIGDALKASVAPSFRADQGGEATFEVLKSWMPFKRREKVRVRIERIGRWTLYNVSGDGRAFNQIDVSVGVRSAKFTTYWR